MIAGQAATNWRRVHATPGNPEADATVRETMTVSSAGPISPGQDVLVVLYPRAAEEPAPQYEILGDGTAKITTAEGTDYIFVDRKPMTFRHGDVEFEGIAGAVRIRRNEVHLVIAEGPGRVSYRGTILRSPAPTMRVLRNDELSKPRTLDVPRRPRHSHSLDSPAERLRRFRAFVGSSSLAATRLEFRSELPLNYAQGDGLSRPARGYRRR